MVSVFYRKGHKAQREGMFAFSMVKLDRVEFVSKDEGPDEAGDDRRGWVGLGKRRGLRGDPEQVLLKCEKCACAEPHTAAAASVLAHVLTHNAVS